MNYSKTTTSFNFEKTDFNLSKFLTKTTTHRKLQEMEISTLLMCVNYTLIKKEIYNNKNINCNSDSFNEIMSEVYNRIFKPLYLFLLSSIVIFLLTFNNEKKNFKKIKSFVKRFKLDVAVLPLELIWKGQLKYIGFYFVSITYVFNFIHFIL